MSLKKLEFTPESGTVDTYVVGGVVFVGNGTDFLEATELISVFCLSNSKFLKRPCYANLLFLDLL